MSIYAMADLHLDIKSNEKSMEIFGNRWQNYVTKIKNNWLRLITEDDTVIIPGDISWALSLNDSIYDLRWIDELPGKKILLKGNHDFWWATQSKMSKFLEENCNSYLFFSITSDFVKLIMFKPPIFKINFYIQYIFYFFFMILSIAFREIML